jgi:hypothetical protein
MADITSNTDNTIQLSATFDLQINSGMNAIAQDVRQALHTVQGEWFLNTNAGLDYINAFGKGTGRYLDSEIKRVVLKRPGVFMLKNYTRTQEQANGFYTITADVVSSAGEFPINF